jgi:CRISPR-associated endonuclease/helicase Cas3
LVDNNKPLAHYDDQTPLGGQLLTDHLMTVSEISGRTGEVIGMGSMSKLIGLLHDLGKCSREFQAYIRGKYKGRVNHSSAGAIILDQVAKKVWADYDIDNFLKSRRIRPDIWHLYREIMQYPILAHHGLYDIIDNKFDYHTGIRLAYAGGDREEYTRKMEDYFNSLNTKYEYTTGKSIYHTYHEGFIEFIKIRKKLYQMALNIKDVATHNKKTRGKALYFYYGSLVRLLLSILKNADIYDSSNYYREQKDKIYSWDELNLIWERMGESIETLYEGFNKKVDKSQLDIIRTDLANQIYNFSQEYDKGVYKLDMPVGSGKTYAALRYSIANARKFKKSRIFYATAFLSVLEQNASSIKQALAGKQGNEYIDEHILEHHSNIIEEFVEDEDREDRKEYEVTEYLKESWESPIILTTIVQLSNTMFKDRSSNIRRFCKLINSVLIIDEVQSLPTKAIYNFNLMTNFLVNIMNCNLVHCTATQPSFDNNDVLKYPCFYGDGTNNASIISGATKTEVFDRVDYYSLLGGGLDIVLNTQNLTDHIIRQLEVENSALIVLNTKKAVANLYNSLFKDKRISELGWEVIYLTTNQCPKHRLDIIEGMKGRLKKLREGYEHRKLICVSTKLVEAGVDIDFDVVYRSLAGIDNIIQCGGRCNREGKKKDKGKLFIFEYGDESLRYLPDIQKQRDAGKTALRVLERENDTDTRVDIERALDHYFHKLYANDNVRGRNLEFPIDNENTILDLLTINPKGTSDYQVKYNRQPKFMIKQAFKTAAVNFDLINENTINVITPYENKELLEQLYMEIDIQDYHGIKRMLKRLQPYTIAIRRTRDYEVYVSKELDGQIFILNQENYNHRVGLIEGELQPLVF